MASADMVKFSDQIDFQGSVPCLRFEPNRFRANFCSACTALLEAHRREAVVDEEHVRCALEYTAKGEKTPSTVLPPNGRLGGLYLGGLKGVTNASWLKEANITHVVNTAKGLEMFGPIYTKAVQHAQESGVSFLCTDWVDSSDFTIPIDDLTRAIHWVHAARQAGGNVFVHCAQGRSRSSTLVIAYVATFVPVPPPIPPAFAPVAPNPDGTPGSLDWQPPPPPTRLEHALMLVTTARAMAKPNPGFTKQLEQWERERCWEQIQKSYEERTASSA